MATETAPPHPKALFSNLSREHDYEPAEVEGQLPEHMQGTLYRNGIGLMDLFGRRYEHLFEADGAISAFRFDEGRVASSSRIVESRALREERRKGRHLSSMNAGWLDRIRCAFGAGYKNTANTNVVAHEGELLALMEGGLPTRVDAETLATIGECDLGAIDGTFSAHPHRNSSRKSLYNFGFQFGKVTNLVVYALKDMGELEVLCRVPIDSPLMVHDFAVSENHLVFFLCPLKFKIWRIMLALKGFEKNLSWNPELGTEVVVIPIDEPSRVTRFHVEPFLAMHFAGAFEVGPNLFVDYVRYPNAELLGALGDGRGLSWSEGELSAPPGKLCRATISLEDESFESRARLEIGCEFPRLAPGEEGRRFENVWLQTELYVDGVLRFQVSRIDSDDNVTHHRLGAGEQCSEPVVVEDGHGRAASVVSLVFDAKKSASHLLVLDAYSLEFQAKVRLVQPIPLTFHGNWVPAGAR